MTDLLTAANLGRLVLAVALVSVGYWTRDCTGPEGPERDSMRVVFRQDVMEVGDVVQPTEPEEVKVYQAPDSQDTHTDCVTLPLWISRLSDTTIKAATEPKGSADTSGATSEWSPESKSVLSSAQLAGLPYVITPMTRGRPSLSVTPERATLSAIDPRTGAGLEYAWDVPKPTWSADWASAATAGLDAATLTSALYATRHGKWGELGIGPAGQVVVTQQGYSASPALSIRYEMTLYSR